MNIEQAYIKSIETERVVEIVGERLNGRLKDMNGRLKKKEWNFKNW